MSSVFDILGVADDADERTIKRAYARLVKLTRPDSDPEGFQQLHEAYQRALQYARWRVPEEEDESAEDGLAVQAPAEDPLLLQTTSAQSPALRDDTTSVALSPPAFSHDDDANNIEPEAAYQVKLELDALLAHSESLLAAQNFDFDAFCAEAERRAHEQTPAQVSQWLQQHEALYRMNLKRQVGADLFERWQQGSQVLRLDRLAAFSQFFDIDDAALRERMRMRMAVANDKTDEFGESHPRVIRQLKRRFSLPQALLTALVPGMAGRVSELGRRLMDFDGDLPAPLQAQQFQFFSQLSDPRYAGVWRWCLMAVRAAVVAILAAVVIPWAATRNFDPLQIGALAGAVVLGLQLVFWLLAWQQREQDHASGWRAQVFGLLPVWLALLALLIDASTAWTLAAALVASVSALAHWRRSFDALRFLLGGMWMWGMFAPVHTHISHWTWSMVCVPLGLTLFDSYYAHQHGLPLRLVAGNRWTSVASYGFFLSWLGYRMFAVFS